MTEIVIPCDAVLLSGSCIVNEASLTGESQPQMKDSLKSETAETDERSLNIEGRDRVHTLFSGTSRDMQIVATDPSTFAA